MRAPRCHRSPHSDGNRLFPLRDLEKDCHEDRLVGKMPSSLWQPEGWMDAGVCSGRAVKAGTPAWVWRTFPGFMLQHKQCVSSRAHSTIHTAKGPHFVTRTAAEARRDGRRLGLLQETWKEAWTSPRDMEGSSNFSLPRVTRPTLSWASLGNRAQNDPQ